MYKDKNRQKEANRASNRRYRAKKENRDAPGCPTIGDVGLEGITQGITGITQGITQKGDGFDTLPKDVQCVIDDLCPPDKPDCADKRKQRIAIAVSYQQYRSMQLAGPMPDAEQTGGFCEA